VFRVESNVPAYTRRHEAALERALRRVVVHWHGEARQRAPVDTGRLQSSIAFAAPGTNPAVMIAGTPDHPAGYFQPPPTVGLEGIVGSNVDYAAPVHENHPDPHKRHFIEAPGRENGQRYRGVISDELADEFAGEGRAADD
jgi:hypothetical protein